LSRDGVVTKRSINFDKEGARRHKGEALFETGERRREASE